MPDSYKTVLRGALAELNRERSRFIAQVKRVNDLASAQSLIESVRNENKQATHHCSAMVLGADSSFELYDDDGEPHGSAGRPILGEIHTLGLTNVVVVVTRYFGGKKLGIRGLIDAYGDVAKKALQQAGCIDVVKSATLHILTDYKHVDNINHQVGLFSAMVKDKIFMQKVELTILVAESQLDDFTSAIKPFILDMEVLNKKSDE